MSCKTSTTSLSTSTGSTCDHLQELFRANLAGPHKSPFELPSIFNDDELLDAWSVCEATDNTLHVAIAWHSTGGQ
jgi:hypothetical protein